MRPFKYMCTLYYNSYAFFMSLFCICKYCLICFSCINKILILLIHIMALQIFWIIVPFKLYRCFLLILALYKYICISHSIFNRCKNYIIAANLVDIFFVCTESGQRGRLPDILVLSLASQSVSHFVLHIQTACRWAGRMLLLLLLLQEGGTRTTKMVWRWSWLVVVATRLTGSYLAALLMKLLTAIKHYAYAPLCRRI